MSESTNLPQMCVSYSRLRDVLGYDPETGEFTWKERISIRVIVGARAGAVNASGYVVIGIDGILYYAHQLAWFYMTGEWAPRIDHRDTRCANNAFKNLRPATASQNGHNMRKPKNNTSGFKGVWYSKGRWEAAIWKEGKKIWLGRYDTPLEGHIAYRVASERLNGEFARAA